MFEPGDRVKWQRVNDGGTHCDGHGAVERVNNALEKVYVHWDGGKPGWSRMDEVELLDVVTRLGDLA